MQLATRVLLASGRAPPLAEQPHGKLRTVAPTDWTYRAIQATVRYRELELAGVGVGNFRPATVPGGSFDDRSLLWSFARLALCHSRNSRQHCGRLRASALQRDNCRARHPRKCGAVTGPASVRLLPGRADLQG